MSFRSSTENETIAAIEPIHALRNQAPAAPYSHIDDAQVQALEQLAKFFQRATFQPQQQVPTMAPQQQTVSTPRVDPSFTRVTSPFITVTQA